MIVKWFQRVVALRLAKPAGRIDQVVARLGTSDQTLLVDFLCNAQSILALSPPEALLCTRYMSLRQYATGAHIFDQGDADSSNYMLWILQGDATIETAATLQSPSLIVSVMEPGSSLGEMALMDGGPRSATCVVCSPMRCAILTRQGLKTLSIEHPDVAVKLMAIICIGLAVRTRVVTDKFKRYVALSNAIRDKDVAESKAG